MEAWTSASGVQETTSWSFQISPKGLKATRLPNCTPQRLFCASKQKNEQTVILTIVLYYTGHLIIHFCVLNHTLEVKKGGAVRFVSVVRLCLTCCDLEKETTEILYQAYVIIHFCLLGKKRGAVRSGQRCMGEPGATTWIEVQACSCMPYEEKRERWHSVQRAVHPQMQAHMDLGVKIIKVNCSSTLFQQQAREAQDCSCYSGGRLGIMFHALQQMDP